MVICYDSQGKLIHQGKIKGKNILSFQTSIKYALCYMLEVQR